MKIEDLIHLHNDRLNRKVEENIFLNQRIKARLKDSEHTKLPIFGLPFKKSILVYSFLLLVFTLLNFMFINGLKKQDTPPKPTEQVVLAMNAFSPTYPGSISRAYKEVMK